MRSKITARSITHDYRAQNRTPQETALCRHPNGRVHSFGKYLQPAWDEAYDWMKSKDIKPSGPAIIRYLTTDMSKDLDIDVGFTVDKAVKGDDRIIADFLPAGRYATVIYTGPYKGKGIFNATVALLEWAKENKIKGNITKKKGVE
jgi:effector-binding domain-containing protein